MRNAKWDKNIFMQREQHETKILKRLLPGLVHQKHQYEHKTGNIACGATNEYLACVFELCIACFQLRKVPPSLVLSCLVLNELGSADLRTRERRPL